MSSASSSSQSSLISDRGHCSNRASTSRQKITSLHSRRASTASRPSTRSHALPGGAIRLADQEKQPFHWRVVPCLNPDGVLSGVSRRVNARGVDLNRNFPTPDWDSKAVAYWKEKTKSDQRRFPGKKANSEPETQWLASQIKTFRPNAIVSIHAPYGVLDFDGPRTPPKRLGFLNLSELGTYPGSMGNYAGNFLGIPIITIELPHSEASPTVAQSGKIWSDLLQWLEKSLPQGAPPLFQRLSDPNWLRNAP
jgi:hypothetical protein